MNSSLSCPSDRQNYIDGTLEEALKHEFFQPKYDGIWGRVVSGEAEPILVYSRTSTIKAEIKVEGYPRNSVFLAEYMFGSQWAQHVDRVGKLYFFDCLVSEGKDISGLPYRERYKELLRQLGQVALSDNRVCFVPNYSIRDLPRFWDKINQDHSYEGIVARNWNQTYNDKLFRCKIDITDDFVCIRANEGTGRLVGTMGSVTVGQFLGGELVEVMTVGGGFSDELRKEIWLNRANIYGHVMEVVGKARFDSGALRHPNFLRFRFDKAPISCKLKKKEE